MHADYRFFRIAVLIFVPFLLWGCSSVKAPRFETVGVRQVEQSDSRTVYNFAIKATNPNKEPIPLRQFTYTIKLDNTHTFTGVRSPETTLHTYADHTFEVPAVFQVAPSELSGTIEYTLNGSAKYLKPGKLAEVMFDTGFSVPKAQFTHRGMINTDE